MSTEVQVALIGLASAVLVALLGLLVEAVRSRRGNKQDHTSVLTEIAALHETQDAMQGDVKEIRAEQGKQGERLARIEGQFEAHLIEGLRRR